MNLSRINKIESIILAAGKSGRIGQPKPFLKFKDKTFISEIITKLNHFSEKIVIVFGFQGELMKENLFKDLSLKQINDKLIVEINRNYERGMFSSLQCGISKVGNCDFVLVHLVDQPQLPFEFYINFIEQLESNIDWFQPSFNKKPGHPVIMTRDIASKILLEDFDSNLRDFVRKNNLIKKIWECNYPQIHQDIDNIEDYEKLTMEI